MSNNQASFVVNILWMHCVFVISPQMAVADNGKCTMITTLLSPLVSSRNRLKAGQEIGSNSNQIKKKTLVFVLAYTMANTLVFIFIENVIKRLWFLLTQATANVGVMHQSQIFIPIFLACDLSPLLQKRSSQFTCTAS